MRLAKSSIDHLIPGGDYGFSLRSWSSLMFFRPDQKQTDFFLTVQHKKFFVIYLIWFLHNILSSERVTKFAWTFYFVFLESYCAKCVQKLKLLK